MAGPSFYNKGDQAIYNAGDKFIPQREYLDSDYIPTKGISYEGDGSPVSYANAMGNQGIMTQTPLKYIPQGEGGGDGGPPGPPGDDEEDGGWQDNLGGMKPGKGTLGSNLKNVFGFVTNPIGYMGYKTYGAVKQAREAKKQKEFYESMEAKTVQDMARENKHDGDTGGYQAGYGGGFMDGNPGSGRGNKSSDKGGSDTMGSFKDGGRTGYFFGGRVKYSAGGRVSFKNGGLASLI